MLVCLSIVHYYKARHILRIKIEALTIPLVPVWWRIFWCCWIFFTLKRMLHWPHHCSHVAEPWLRHLHCGVYPSPFPALHLTTCLGDLLSCLCSPWAFLSLLPSLSTAFFFVMFWSFSILICRSGTLTFLFALTSGPCDLLLFSLVLLGQRRSSPLLPALLSIHFLWLKYVLTPGLWLSH